MNYMETIDERERTFLLREKAMAEKCEHDAWESGKIAGREIERAVKGHNRALENIFTFAFGLASGLSLSLWITIHWLVAR